MKNILRFVFIISLFLFFSVTQIFAEEIANPTNSNGGLGSLVADVNISEAEIISTSGNVFSISFKLTNGEGLQTGVKYGVKLFSIGKEGQPLFVVDEKIYGETLILKPNSVLSKEISYEAPVALSGDYLLALSSANENGLPLGLALIGQIPLISSSNGIEINYDTCLIKKESKNKEVVELALSDYLPIIIDQGDSLFLTCTAINHKNETVSVKPSFETHHMDIYGKLVLAEGGDTNFISFDKLEEKSFSILLPHSTKPGIYYLKTTLNGEGFQSNPVNINYLVKGFTANIYNLSFDRDYYEKGDTAKVSVLWGTLGSINGDLFLNLSIKNKRGNSCGSDVKETLLQNARDKNTKMDFLISKDCSNPQVLVSLSDENGNIVDEKIFSFKTKEGSPLNYYKILILIFLILVIIFLIVYLKKKKNMKKNNVLMQVFILFSLLTVFSLTPINFVNAATYSLANNVFFTISMTSGTTYYYNENIVVTSDFSLNGQPSSYYALTGHNTGDNKNCTFSVPTGSCNFKAPASSGSYNINYTLDFPNNVWYMGSDYNFYLPGHYNGVESWAYLSYPATENEYFLINYKVYNSKTGDVISRTGVPIVVYKGETASEYQIKEEGYQNNNDDYWKVESACITHKSGSKNLTFGPNLCY